MPLTNIGTYYGKRCLNVRNGFVSLVTTSESAATIYITTNGAATSVENIKQNEIKIYPNPSNDFINIELNSKINKVEIYDLGGRLVLVDEGVYTARFVRE